LPDRANAKPRGQGPLLPILSSQVHNTCSKMDHHRLDQLALCISSLRGGKYSDCSIRCSDGVVIGAHCAIICSRSRVFAAAIDGQFQESISHEIYLEDDEPDIVVKMIDFLYGLDYDDCRSTPRECSTHAGNQNVDVSMVAFHGINRDTMFANWRVREPPSAPPPEDVPDDVPEDIVEAVAEESTNSHQLYNSISLTTNAKVFIIADKYEIQALKEWAVIKYKEVLPSSWNSPNFIESACLIYNNTLETDRILRDVIVQEASKNIKELLDRGEFVDLLKRHGDFAAEVLKEVVYNFEPAELVGNDRGSWGTKKSNKFGCR